MQLAFCHFVPGDMQVSGYFRGVFEDSSPGAADALHPMPMITAADLKGCQFHGVLTDTRVVVDIERPSKLPRVAAKSYFCRTDLTGKHTYADGRLVLKMLKLEELHSAGQSASESVGGLVGALQARQHEFCVPLISYDCRCCCLWHCLAA